MTTPSVKLTPFRARRRKLDNALARLNALYLYDDEAMPEKDFVMQRGQITKQLEEVDARIEELQNQESSEELGERLHRQGQLLHHGEQAD